MAHLIFLHCLHQLKQPCTNSKRACFNPSLAVAAAATAVVLQSKSFLNHLSVLPPGFSTCDCSFTSPYAKQCDSTIFDSILPSFPAFSYPTLAADSLLLGFRWCMMFLRSDCTPGHLRGFKTVCFPPQCVASRILYL
jgi:hypothetical protein